MPEDTMKFGDYLRKQISRAQITQSAFYSAVGITKPYFYDILSGKTKPPPLDIQNRMIVELEKNLEDEKTLRNSFLNIAARGRQEIPADISKLILSHPDKWDAIRAYLEKHFTEDR